MDANEIINSLVNNVLLPLLMSLGSAILIAVRNYIKRIVKSIEAKNDLESLTKLNEMKSLLLNEIGTIVDAAVGSNMQLADKMKSDNEDHKLTEDQVNELSKAARTLIMSALPPTLTEENGSLLNIIGGKDRLDTIIDGMLEKYVYEYKIKTSESKKSNASDNKNNTNKSSAQRKTTKYFGD